MNLSVLEATKCRCRKSRVARTCLAGPRFSPNCQAKAADLQNKSALRWLACSLLVNVLVAGRSPFANTGPLQDGAVGGTLSVPHEVITGGIVGLSPGCPNGAYPRFVAAVSDRRRRAEIDATMWAATNEPADFG